MPKPLKLWCLSQRRRRSCPHSFHSNRCLQNLHSIFSNCSTEESFTFTTLTIPPVAFPRPLSKPNAAFREPNCAFLLAGNLYSLLKRVKTISEECFKLRFGLQKVSIFYGSSCFLMPLYVPFFTFFKFSICHMRRMFINLNWFWSSLIPKCVSR